MAVSLSWKLWEASRHATIVRALSQEPHPIEACCCRRLSSVVVWMLIVLVVVVAAATVAVTAAAVDISHSIVLHSD